MANYLRFRNPHFYLRIRIPSDLHGIIPEVEILKSLRTKNHKTAMIAASRLHGRILEIFALSRSGLISPVQTREQLDGVLGRSNVKRRPKSQWMQELPQNSSPSLSKVIVEYVNDKQSAWTQKTKLEYSGYFRLIQDVLKIESASDITRDAVRILRDNLSQLPANLYKKYPTNSISDILQMKCITPMSTTTVNKLLKLFSSVMLHCVREGYLKENPAKGIKIQQNKRACEERKAYSGDDLKRLFSSLPSSNDKPEKLWIPLIGLYSGMRLGEICGLHVNDVRCIDGVWCFDINDEDNKRLKTLSSKRVVPIHPHLIGCGFLVLVEALNSNEVIRLWPNLKKREIDGYCHSFGNWFGRFNRKHVTTDPLKSFHSLRHTFADALKQQGEQEVLIAELMGHANGSITTGRYGKCYQPKVLLEAVCKLDFGVSVLV